jgi:hypothetical protein
MLGAFMRLRRILIVAAVSALLPIAAGRSQAADQKAAVDKIKAHYQAAAAAYDDGDFEKTKSQLLEAIALGKESHLASHKVVAQSYLLLGVLEVAGFKNLEAGVRDFAKALDISPAIQIPPSMATKAVLAAFEKAENQDSPSAGGASNAKETGAAAEAEAGRDKRGRDDKLVDDLAQARVGESVEQAEKAKLQKELQDKDRQLAEMKGRVQQLEQQVNQEKQDQDRQLAAARESERKERDGNEKVEKVRAESDRQLADAKARLQQLKQETDRQLTAARESEKKERDADERLEKAKAESDRLLADAKARLQQLAKEKQESDRLLASTKETEKKEREARERLEKARLEAEGRDKERKSREAEAQAERDKLADGPDLPSHFTEPIYCTVPDDIPAGIDLYVHCVPQPSIATKVVALYYRSGGAVVYNAATMERSKKGWYTTVVPGSRITGKLLHYYVEARDSRQAVVASNGRAGSPNIAVVRSGNGHRPAQ